MARVHIDQEYLTLRLGWVDSLFAMRRFIRVPLDRVRVVRVRPELPAPLDLYADGFWRGMAPGHPLPGVTQLGDDRIFCEMHIPENAIAIDLDGDVFSCLVFEVEGETPGAVAERIVSAARGSAILAEG